MQLHIGTAGWSLPRALAESPAGPGTHLQRYARTMNAVEIDSSFHRPHRPSTYERWAASTPAGFRFAVKLPRTITHEARLRPDDATLAAFLAQVAGLGGKLGVLLVQLAPSHAFDAGVVDGFFARLRGRVDGAIVCEPRHRTWFTDAAEALLARHRVGRVAADPAVVPAAAEPGGWLGHAGDGAGAVVYHRWHGSPQTYWSRYDEAWIAERARRLARWPPACDAWCVFDNTAAGAALENARQLLRACPRADAQRTTG